MDWFVKWLNAVDDCPGSLVKSCKESYERLAQASGCAHRRLLTCALAAPAYHYFSWSGTKFKACVGVGLSPSANHLCIAMVKPLGGILSLGRRKDGGPASCRRTACTNLSTVICSDSHFASH